jgi:hypothetical protein
VSAALHEVDDVLGKKLMGVVKAGGKHSDITPCHHKVGGVMNANEMNADGQCALGGQQLVAVAAAALASAAER